MPLYTKEEKSAMKVMDETKTIVESVLKESQGKGQYAKPHWHHYHVFDSPREGLEPIYFWILDFAREHYAWEINKVIDNFSSSPGSGHFATMGTRATVMEKEGIQMMERINAVLRSIINLIYDLKEFEIRLKEYTDLESKDSNEKEAAMLALKQIWMDKVDIKRGRGSINMLTYDLQFVTLRDAFMKAKTLKEVDDIDLNDRVKRILKPRLHEFLDWVEVSQRELEKRFAVEKNYLKSQVSSLKLYMSWAKPYLRYAEQLRVKESDSPDLVTAFNTTRMEIVWLCRSKLNPNKIRDAAAEKLLPTELYNALEKKKMQMVYPAILVHWEFRGIPYQIGQEQHFVHGGRVDLKLWAYTLREDEWKKVNEKIEKHQINDAYKLVLGSTEESLKELEEDLDRFAYDKKDEKKDKEKKKENKKSKTKKIGDKILGYFFKRSEKKEEKLRKDNEYEKVLRRYSAFQAAKACFKWYDTFKKSRGYPSVEDMHEQLVFSEWWPFF